ATFRVADRYQVVEEGGPGANAVPRSHVFATCRTARSAEPGVGFAHHVCDLPDVPAGVAHHGAAIAVRGVERLLDRRGPGSERARVRRVRVGDVDVEECREDLAVGCRCHQYERVTDTDLRGSADVRIARGVEHGTQERDLPRDVGDDHARGD